FPAGKRVDHAARAEASLELGVFGIIDALRLFFSVQVVKIAEELVEAMGGGQVFVEVAEVILAELAGRVAQRLEQLGDGRVFLLETEIGAGQSDLSQTGADRRLAGGEGCATGGAALLAVPVGEYGPVPSDTVDVWRPVPHHAHVIGADVVPADV